MALNIAHSNLAKLKERTGLSRDEVERFIEYGVLLPESDRYGDLESCYWHDDEIARYERLCVYINERMHPLYKDMMSQLAVHVASVNKSLEFQNRQVRQLSAEVRLLRRDVFQQNEKLTLVKFCRITGSKYQTCLNNVMYVDPSKTMMHLKKSFLRGRYSGLRWHMEDGKWQTSFGDFNKLRSGFPNEVFWEEEDRLGTRTKKLVVNLEDLE